MEILSYSIEKKHVTYNTVLNIKETLVDIISTIKIGEIEINCTPNHAFLTENK